MVGQDDSQLASKPFTDFVRETNAFLGGSSLGKGLKKAAGFYLQNRSALTEKPQHFELPGFEDLNQDGDVMPLEDSFYVVDIGVLASQVYQWRKSFPRVEPFYAVKCNPDPVVVRTLALLGTNFDCASRNEIRLVRELTKDLPRQPEIIYANPCKARGHLVEAICQGVKLVTFDNAAEVVKCAKVSKNVELILRIVTDDRGSQCRLSSKFGAPQYKWKPLLQVAKKHGLPVVGVSFHVGSGCRDASRYEAALKDARSIFDMAEKEFGMKMRILDIGGGFPGETHSLWNPLVLDDDEEVEDEDEEAEDGIPEAGPENDRFMFFTEIAEQVAPVLDELFPASSGVRIIGEPGRFFVAAAGTLICSVIGTRSNELDSKFEPEPIIDQEAAEFLAGMSREDECRLVDRHSLSKDKSQRFSLGQGETDPILESIAEELADFSSLYARQALVQQEADAYNDTLDLYKEGYETATDLLGPPDEEQMENAYHTVEGMGCSFVADFENDGNENGEVPSALVTLASAGEAAVSGVVMQAVADSAPLQDDYAYYINDGVYGAFNNIMFDHATVRPRVLQVNRKKVRASKEQGFYTLSGDSDSDSDHEGSNIRNLYASTVFGPTCDSIDVIARSVLLPKLEIGDWMYFQNMGAYTMAAASSFNGFTPTEKFYVCSVQPEYFEPLVVGCARDKGEEKKEE